MIKPTSSLRTGALAFAVLSAMASLPLSAASLYWDTDNASVGVGGSGTWDTVTSNWNSASGGTGSVLTWSNTTNAADFADFRGSGGSIAVTAGGVRAGRLEFNGGAYSLSGGAVTLTTTTLVNGGSGSGAVTLDNNLLVDTASVTGNASHVVQTTSVEPLTINGTIGFAYSTGTPSGAKTVSLRANNADGSIVFNGTVGTPFVGTSTQLQVFGNSTGRHYINGDNSSLSNSTSGQIVRGQALLGHAKAMGNNTIQIGISSTGAGDTAALLTNGALTIANNLSVGGANATSHLIVGGATADVSEFTGTVNAGTGGQSLRLSAVAGGRVNFSGNVSGSGTNGGVLIKQGAGVVGLTRAAGSTYSRETYVDQGALVIANTTGSATGTGGVFVADGATFAGTGISTGLVTASAAGSRISAGDLTAAGVSSLGTLNLTGGLTAASGATFDFDINGASVDTINFGAGAVDIDGTATFNFTSLDSVLTDTSYSLFTGTGDWSSISASFVINAPAGYSLSSTYGGGLGYVFDAASHSLTVQFSAIPEPSSIALLGGALVLGFAAVRRRRAAR